MAKNIWKMNLDVKNKPKRNNFDLSFQSHSTFKFGYLYPVFKRRVFPGDSFKIDSAFDLKMMPLAFPIQSRFRAHMHFFYVRNKNLWNHWEDWISGLKDNDRYPHPYLDITDDKVKTGSIHDFLGQPTTVVSSHVSERSVSFNGFVSSIGSDPVTIPYFVDGVISPGSLSRVSFLTESSGSSNRRALLGDFYNQLDGLSFSISDSMIFVLRNVFPYTRSGYFGICGKVLGNEYITECFCFECNLQSGVVDFSQHSRSFSDFLASHTEVRYFISPSFEDEVGYLLGKDNFVLSVPYTVPEGFRQVSDLGLGVYNTHIKLNALPYRAYESIYRAYYANDVLQPLVIDGEKDDNQ